MEYFLYGVVEANKLIDQLKTMEMAIGDLLESYDQSEKDVFEVSD